MKRRNISILLAVVCIVSAVSAVSFLVKAWTLEQRYAEIIDELSEIPFSHPPPNPNLEKAVQDLLFQWRLLGIGLTALAVICGISLVYVKKHVSKKNAVALAVMLPLLLTLMPHTVAPQVRGAEKTKWWAYVTLNNPPNAI